MNRIITFETIRNFAYVNHEIVKKPIRGIVLNFFGLGNKDMIKDENAEGEYYGDQGILYVHPYTNPWNWMNRQAVAYTDELLDVLIEALGLDDSIPVVSTGGSMGGMSALVYSYYAKRTPVACVANCPVCDMPYHLTERPDLPRTLYSAFWHEEGELAQVLEAYSPLHLAAKMPQIPYTIFHCTKDMSVNKEKHSDRFVAAMRESGHEVNYVIVPDRGHCDLPYAVKKQYKACIANAILNRA